MLIGLSAYSQEFPAPTWAFTDIDNDSAYLSWYSPNSKSLSHYNIYYYGFNDDQPLKIASTTDTTFSWLLPEFRYSMNFLLCAEYEDPQGISDTLYQNWTILTLMDLPVEFSFEDYNHRLFTSNLVEGAVNWELTNSNYYSETHSAVFAPTSENEKCQLISAPYSCPTSVIVKFMCKIPSNGEKSDTLRVGKMNLVTKHYYSEPLTNINDWQQLQFELGTGEYHLFFEATSGMGNGIFIDNIKIESATNIQNIIQGNFPLKIAPHPVIENSTISLPENIHKAHLKIYAANGQVLLSETINKSLTISKNDYPSGVYLYEATLENGVISKGKIVIK